MAGMLECWENRKTQQPGGSMSNMLVVGKIVVACIPTYGISAHALFPDFCYWKPQVCSHTTTKRTTGVGSCSSSWQLLPAHATPPLNRAGKSVDFCHSSIPSKNSGVACHPSVAIRSEPLVWYAQNEPPERIRRKF